MGRAAGPPVDGKCEADPERECAWVSIYERLKEFGELDQLQEVREPKDWSKMQRPRQITVAPLACGRQGTKQ